MDSFFSDMGVLDYFDQLYLCVGSPDRQADALRILTALIESTKGELQGPNLELHRNGGDLDDSSGASHIVNDDSVYVPPGGLFPVYCINENERAAANLLLGLYLALPPHESVLLDLTHECVEDLRNRATRLIAFNLQGPALQKHFETEKKSSGGRIGGSRKALSEAGQRKIFEAYDRLTKTQKQGAGIAQLIADTLEISPPTVRKYLDKLHPGWNDHGQTAPQKNKK